MKRSMRHGITVCLTCFCSCVYMDLSRTPRRSETMESGSTWSARRLLTHPCCTRWGTRTTWGSSLSSRTTSNRAWASLEYCSEFIHKHKERGVNSPPLIPAALHWWRANLFFLPSSEEALSPFPDFWYRISLLRLSTQRHSSHRQAAKHSRWRQDS